MKMVSEKRAIDKVFLPTRPLRCPGLGKRQEVWNRDKKQRLIDSILRGWKLPKFYFIEGSGEELSRRKMDSSGSMLFGSSSLKRASLSAEAAKQFGGRYYRELPRAIADSFDDFEINFDVISGATDAELES